MAKILSYLLYYMKLTIIIVHFYVCIVLQDPKNLYILKKLSLIPRKQFWLPLEYFNIIICMFVLSKKHVQSSLMCSYLEFTEVKHIGRILNKSEFTTEDMSFEKHNFNRLIVAFLLHTYYLTCAKHSSTKSLQTQYIYLYSLVCLCRVNLSNRYDFYFSRMNLFSMFMASRTGSKNGLNLNSNE